DPEAIPITQLDLPNDSCPIDKGPILTVEILDQRPVASNPQNAMTLTDDKTTWSKVASSIRSDRERRAHHRNGPTVPFTGRHRSQMNSHLTPFVDKTLPVLPINWSFQNPSHLTSNEKRPWTAALYGFSCRFHFWAVSIVRKQTRQRSSPLSA